MIKCLLLTACLGSTTPTALLAQTPPAAVKATPSAVANSLETRIQAYFADLSQRQRAIYFAPSDGRAIALLSDAITEFTARRKGLLAEAEQLKAQPATARRAAKLSVQSLPWVQDQQTLLASTAAAKLPARRQRNPALDMALRRFETSQFHRLGPPLAPAE